MTSTANLNGQQRKSLAAQLDRLDAVLDGLAENLNDAVAQAVKDAVIVAVQEAVRVVLNEALLNPALLAKLQAASPAAPVATPVASVAPPRPRERLASCRRWVRECGQQGLQHGATLLQGLQQQLAVACQCSRPVWRFKTQIVLALSVGLTLSLASFWAGPILSAVANGLCGFVAALAVQLGLWLRRLLAPTPLPLN